MKPWIRARWALLVSVLLAALLSALVPRLAWAAEPVRGPGPLVTVAWLQSQLGRSDLLRLF